MLNVAFLNVGQGDTTVVWSPQSREAIVVDCLKPVAALDLLRREKVQRVRAVVITHLHADHYAGLVTFLKGCQPRGIEWDALYFQWLTQIQKRTQLLDDDDQHSHAEEDNSSLQRKKRLNLFQTLAGWMSEPGNKRRHKPPDLLTAVNLSGMTIEILHPISGDIGHLMQSGKLNNLSTVLRVSSSNASVLLTGDLEPEGWDVLWENTPDLSSNVLKFPHHGAWRRDDVDALLERVRPQVVIMSVGTIGHKYRHPNPHVFEALKHRKEIKVLCTQATRQCTSAPKEVKDRVQVLLEEIESGFSGLATNKGCPCASTIIIELGVQARVVYPSQDTHSQIIAECFPSAQCLKTRKAVIPPTDTQSPAR
jgi:competence protein ComEC